MKHFIYFFGLQKEQNVLSVSKPNLTTSLVLEVTFD